MKYEDIVDKVEKIKSIQRRRVNAGETYHKVGDALALNVEEAEYLIDMIEKVRGLTNDQLKHS